MSPQDCNNCYYPAPGEKKEEVAKAPGAPETEECPQCFYQPEVPPEAQTEECPQCFYQPEEGEKKDEECPQCFYKPEK